MGESSRDYTQIEFSDDSVLIYQPRFTDETRAAVKAIVVLPNGQLREITKACADRQSKIVRDIFLQYTVEEIAEFTRREAAVVAKKRAVDEATAARAAREQEQAVTFQAKVKAFEMPEVRAYPDPRLARRIRKAKSAFEVAALVALALQKSFDDEELTEELRP